MLPCSSANLFRGNPDLRCNPSTFWLMTNFKYPARKTKLVCALKNLAPICNQVTEYEQKVGQQKQSLTQRRDTIFQALSDSFKKTTNSSHTRLLKSDQSHVRRCWFRPFKSHVNLGSLSLLFKSPHSWKNQNPLECRFGQLPFDRLVWELRISLISPSLCSNKGSENRIRRGFPFWQEYC